MLIRRSRLRKLETTEKRRKNMRAIKSKSKLEEKVTKGLWNKGVRFRRNTKELFGKPDISIKKYKIVIFIDSCFWHQCPLHSNIPKNNREFWEKKLKRNAERDREVNNYYLENEWKLKRVWEHDINNNLYEVIDELIEFINESKRLS